MVVNKLTAGNNLECICVFESGAARIPKLIDINEKECQDDCKSHFSYLGLLAQGRRSMVPRPTLAVIRPRLMLSTLFVFSFSFVFMLCKKLYQRSTAVLKPLNATDNNILIISPLAKHLKHCFDCPL